MRTPDRPLRPEPVAKSGEVLLSSNHLALLHGLYDRPGGEAFTTADLVRAALPYVILFREWPSQWCLRASTHTLHPAWAARWRIGGRIIWRLTERGRALVDRTVPARIRGLGPYAGLGPIRQRTKLQRRRQAVEARWKEALKGPAFKSLVAGAERLVDAWCRRNAARSSNEAMYFAHRKGVVAAYVHACVLRRRALPSGTENVMLDRNAPQFLVNFEELHASVPVPPDVVVEDHGTVALIRPGSPEAAARLRGLVADDAQWFGGALVCEPRYVAQILEALRQREG